MSETGEIKENGRGNSNIEILTDNGDMESRICCRLASLGSRPHNEGECAECVLELLESTAVEGQHGSRTE